MSELSHGTARCACTSTHEHEGRRLVLTGGPGAGKTAVLEVLRRHLCEHAIVLPEAAGIVFGGGFPRRESDAARRAAQVAIVHVQLQLEELVTGEAPHAIAACDRGVLDGLAYWGGSPEDFYAQAGLTRERLLARYHAVIHLRVPPPSEYVHSTNPLRTESPAMAHAIDERIVAAWDGHPRRSFVESTPRFLEKIRRTLDLVRDALPPCCRGALEGAREIRT